VRFQDDLLEIRKENQRLRQSQQDIRADLAEIQRVRADITRLVEARNGLSNLRPFQQPNISSPFTDSRSRPHTPLSIPKPAPPGYSLPPPCNEGLSEDDEEWLEPPPWPKAEVQEQPANVKPTLEHLSQNLADYQLMRAQARPHQPLSMKWGDSPPAMGFGEPENFDCE